MPDVIVERHDRVMLMRFNRPERMNAMGGTLMPEFAAALEEGTKDDRVGAIVVTGEGRAWCAGADLEAAGQRQESSDVPQRRSQSLDTMGPGRSILAIYKSGKPMIAAVNGVAVGGGFGLCSAFDIRIASDRARFGTIFIKRALASDFGLSYFLPRMVGHERATELFYTGRIVDAEEALQLGIVSRVVPHDQLVEESLEFATQVANQPPTALAFTRRMLQHSQSATIEQQLEFEWPLQRDLLQGPEFKEAVAAFREKREPNYND
ncbi:MAG: enoyl-CoA hydratase-related protein [Chloroflexi bacterium]|nr:enoyl-CoA hydratase-related protein [Chloroflexota bacterium]